MCHGECAPCLVDSRATPALSLFQGRNESTRADPRPSVAGSAPSRTATRNKGAAGGMASAEPGSYTRTRWPAGPLRGSARTAGPAPAPPRPVKEPGNGHPPPPPRAHTHASSRRTQAARGAEAPSPRRFEDPGQRLRGWRERRRGSTPPARRGSRCGHGAYPAVPPLRFLHALRSGSRGRRPSGLGCLRPGWRADPRTRRRCPRRRLRAPAPRPAPGMRTGRLGLRNREGRCPRGIGAEGGRDALTAATGLLGSPPSSTRFPFYRETGERRTARLPSCCALAEGGRAVSDLTQSSPANTLSMFPRKGNWSLERGSDFPQDTRVRMGDPGQRNLRAPTARKFPASTLATLPAISPQTPIL